MATKAQLLGYRNDLADLRTAQRILLDQDLPVDDVRSEIQKLAEWVVGVEVPCLLCKTVQQVPTKVDDPASTVPTGCICAPCDARITAAGLKGECHAVQRDRLRQRR